MLIKVADVTINYGTKHEDILTLFTNAGYKCIVDDPTDDSGYKTYIIVKEV